MAQISDDPPGRAGKPVTRLARVMDYLSDEKIGFIKALLDKNPVYVYRFGNRLDEDAQIVTRGEAGEPVPVHKLPGPRTGLEPGATAPPGATTTGRRSPPTTSSRGCSAGLSDDGAAKVQDDQGVGRQRRRQRRLGDEVARRQGRGDSRRPEPGRRGRSELAIATSCWPASTSPARSAPRPTSPTRCWPWSTARPGTWSRGSSSSPTARAISAVGSGSSPPGRPARCGPSARTSRSSPSRSGREIKSVAVRITDVQAPDQTPAG